MPKPARGDVWLVDMGYAAKVRPALVLSVPIEADERVLTTVVPHTTRVRNTRFESASDVQGIGTYPSVKLIKRLGTLPEEQLVDVELRVRQWLGLA